MIDAMGIFRTTLGVAALATPDERRELTDVMVDTGSEYNWIPSDILVALGVAPVRLDRFETADGRILEREVGSRPQRAHPRRSTPGGIRRIASRANAARAFDQFTWPRESTTLLIARR
jgi:hypothetical protein